MGVPRQEVSKVLKDREKARVTLLENIHPSKFVLETASIRVWWGGDDQCVHIHDDRYGKNVSMIMGCSDQISVFGSWWTW